MPFTTECTDSTLANFELLIPISCFIERETELLHNCSYLKCNTKAQRPKEHKEKVYFLGILWVFVPLCCISDKSNYATTPCETPVLLSETSEIDNLMGTNARVNTETTEIIRERYY